MNDYDWTGNIKELEKIANSWKTEPLAVGVLQLAQEILYLHGCVKRGRGEDIYPNQPGRNVFEYIKELEAKLNTKIGKVRMVEGETV